MESDDIIWVGDYLPTVYEVAQTIYHYSKKPTGIKRENIVSLYEKSLRHVWIQAFGEGHVISALCSKINAVMKDYENRVLRSHNKASLRVRNKEWSKMVLSQKKKGPKCSPQKISSLFDIGKNTDELTGVEKIFYLDQCTERRYRISEEIDLDYEMERQQKEAERLLESQNLQEEMNNINQTEDEEVYALYFSCQSVHPSIRHTREKVHIVLA